MVRSRTIIAVPPGATIKEQLSERGMTQKEFAVRMDLSEKHISKLINGDVHLTPDVALRLELVLGVPASFWNNLEAIYREKVNAAIAENKLEEDERIAKQFPYAEMEKYGWVASATTAKEKAINLRRFFEVVELPLIADKRITKIAYRRLVITEKKDLAVMAWVQQARLVSRKIDTKPINISKVINYIPRIREMTLLDPDAFCEELEMLLSDCGIAIVFLPHLTGSGLQGASFVEGKKIVVGVTVRGKDADRFWFSLFHEIGHIVMGHIGQEDGTSIEDEKDADEWAANALIPKLEYMAFLKKGNYSKQSVIDFSQLIGIDKGIVVGRLQNDAVIKHNMLNDLKTKYIIA